MCFYGNSWFVFSCPEVSTKDYVQDPILFRTPASDMAEQREGPAVRFLDTELLGGSNRPAVHRRPLKLGKWLTEDL